MSCRWKTVFRRVVAFSDPGAYNRWCKKAVELDFNIEVSDYLEKNATAPNINFS